MYKLVYRDDNGHHIDDLLQTYETKEDAQKMADQLNINLSWNAWLVVECK